MLDEIYLELDDKMEKAIEALSHNFDTVRTGRANPAMLDNVMVEAYGTTQNIKSVATINTPDAHTILIQPWDKGTLQPIERAIQAANLGFNPNNDGKVIRLNVPPLTEESRKELVKVAHKYAEDGKIAVRNIRRHANDQVKKLNKDKEVSDDEMSVATDEIQEKTDEHIKKIDELLKHKEEEIMKI